MELITRFSGRPPVALLVYIFANKKTHQMIDITVRFVMKRTVYRDAILIQYVSHSRFAH